MIYVLLAVMIITALFIYGNFYFKTKEFIVKSSKLPKNFDDFTIFHVSDLHYTSYGKDNRRLVEAIRKENPDLIFYTGDMVDEHTFRKNSLFSLIEGLEGKIPSYYIFGNHEDGLKDNEKKELVDFLDKNGVIILRNETAVIKRDQQEVLIHGFHPKRELLRQTYDSHGELQLKKDDLEGYLGPLNSGYHILLAHNPLYGDTYMGAGYDLTLSGHVHGGMIRLPFLGGVFSPDRTFFPKYDIGKYEKNEKSLIVSPGIGGHKARIGNPPKLYKIILKTQ